MAAPFTPLDKHGELNLSQISALVQLYKINQVNAAFICGSTGEGVSLTHLEKIQVLKKWGQEKDDHLKTIFMVGGTCLKEMQELAGLSQQNNMDGISILCPYYFKPKSVTELVAFSKEVADAAPNLPFYYYHIPALTGGNFSMLDYLQQAEDEIPNLAGIKFTAPDLLDFQACRAYKNGKYNLLWGIDEAMLSGLAAGADGAVGSTYNYAAPLFNQIIDSFKKGDLAEASKHQDRAVQMVQLLIKYGGISAGKAFMKLIGVDCGWFRQPIQPLSEQSTNALKAELEEIGFFSYCSKI